MNQDSPSRCWAEHHYELVQREWREELTGEQPDWSLLCELEQELRALEAYLVRLDLDDQL